MDLAWRAATRCSRRFNAFGYLRPLPSPRTVASAAWKKQRAVSRTSPRPVQVHADAAAVRLDQLVRRICPASRPEGGPQDEISTFRELSPLYQPIISREPEPSGGGLVNGRADRRLHRPYGKFKRRTRVKRKPLPNHNKCRDRRKGSGDYI